LKRQNNFGLRPRRNLPDRLKPFPTETDAKQFAKEMLSEKHHMEKHRIVAGTLLGAYLPDRIISGWQLYSWVREQDQQPL
jgi:hypothetical protein